MLLGEQIDKIVGSFSERITLEKAGRVVYTGSISSLVDNYKQLLTQELVSELVFVIGKGYKGVLL
jgi:hypothetical protein